MSHAQRAVVGRTPPKRTRRKGALKPTFSAARIIGVAVIPIAVVATGAVVATASYSAFTANTSSASNSWTAGNVVLTNDSTAVAAFSAVGLGPGSLGQRCITVTSTGSVPSTVKLYASGYTAATNSIASFLNLSITQGTGGDATCSGFTPLASGASLFSGTLDGFGQTSSYTNGLGSWATAGGPSASETRVYRFAYTLDPSTPTTAQNGTASLVFKWEAQNT